MGFSLQNNPKNLDLFYKMDIDFWDCLRRRPHLNAEFNETDLDIWGHSRDKSIQYLQGQINTVLTSTNQYSTYKNKSIQYLQAQINTVLTSTNQYSTYKHESI